MSSADFRVELGYTGTTLATRHYAGVYPFQGVSSLMNAFIDYSTNVEGKENRLTIQIETMTSIPVLGGIYILAPEGFIVVSQKHPECKLIKPMLTEEFIHFPSTIECTRGINSGLVIRPEIKLKVGGTQPLPPGRYVFSLLVVNPTPPVANEVSPSSKCGFTQCFEFSTYADLAMKTGSLDTPIAASGFSVNKKLVESNLVLLTQAQRDAIGRNDRPNKKNSMVFMLKLQEEAREARYRYGAGYTHDHEVQPRYCGLHPL